MRHHARITLLVLLAALVVIAGSLAPAIADAPRYRAYVYPDRSHPEQSVMVDDFRVNETIYDEGGLQYIWVHGPMGNFQLGFDLIRQIEVIKWLGKDLARDDWTRFEVKVTGTADGVVHYGVMEIRVMRGIADNAPWYYFPTAQPDRGARLWRIVFGPDRRLPTIPLETQKPAAPPVVVLLPPAPAPLPPSPAAQPNPDELGDVYFAYDVWDLTQASRETLKRNAEWMKRWPTTRLRIEGQADARGTNEYNIPLGLHRANAARDYLVSLGIASDRLETITMGKTNLICTEANESCWQLNRRAHFVLLSK